MEKVTFKIHCDKYQKRKDGTSSLYIRLTINRKSKLLPLNKFVVAEYFDSKAEKVKEVKEVPNARNLNHYLTSKKLEIDDIIHDLQRRKQAVTFDNVKLAFQGNGKAIYVDFVKKNLKDAIELKERTKYYELCLLNKLEIYHPKLSIYEMDVNWLKKYKRYLIEELGNKQNTVAGDFRCIRKHLKIAVKQGIIQKHPFNDGFSAKRIKVEKEYLDIDELQKALDYYKSKKLLKLNSKDKRGKTYHIGKKYQESLQHFLIGCFSGLRMSDIQSLRMEHIDLKENVIKKRMIKGRKGTEKVVTIPLTSQLREVLDLKSKDVPYKGFLRRSSDVNNWIREILEKIEICENKHISFHCSRHTFAVTCLTLGIPLETVRDLMGHEDINTTLIYAKIVDSKRKKEMDYWSKFNDMI